MKMLSIKKDELVSMLKSEVRPAVSMYMPVHNLANAKEDHTRLKNLLKMAEHALSERKTSAEDTRKILGPIREILKEAAAPLGPGNGLALLATPDAFHRIDLPRETPEVVVVGDNYHIKPLVPLIHESDRFYVLSLAVNQVRFLACDRNGCSIIEPEGLPASAAEVLRADDPEKSLQHHTEAPHHGGVREAQHHGQGGGADADHRVQRFCTSVEKAVSKALANDHAPLVLAGVNSVTPIYEHVNRYDNLLSNRIEGNPEAWSESALHGKAWEIVESHTKPIESEILARFEEALAKKRAENKLREVLAAAMEGRVSTTLIALDKQHPGRVHSNGNGLELEASQSETDEDLINLAAVHTLRHGGSVIGLTREQMPGDIEAGAILRY